MKVELFELNNNEMDKLEEFITKNEINVETFNELAKSINFSFSVEECSRLLSHHICESLDSYTQQSQRYVKMGEDAFVLPEEIKNSTLEKEFTKLTKELFDFYGKITQIKDGFAGRKASESDYVHGIKIEDGRYILPLNTTTNILVTMNFSRIINFYNAMKRLKAKESEDLLKKIDVGIGKTKIVEFINKNIIQKEEEIVAEYSKEIFEKISKENNCILINSFKEPLLRSGLGALTSTNDLGASEIKKQWDINNEASEKSKGVTARVIGYGHTSIIEHARTNFGMTMSLTCYHQFERHRLPENIREQFDQLPIEREIIIPPSVKRNKEILEEFKQKVDKVKILRKKLKENNLPQEYLLLNCDMLKLISSTNARIDNDILSERTCNNAQWEIRNLYIKKLEQLKKLAPILYDNAGPGCTRGKCPEGTLTCGKILEVREKFGYFGSSN